MVILFVILSTLVCHVLSATRFDERFDGFRGGPVSSAKENDAKFKHPREGIIWSKPTHSNGNGDKEQFGLRHRVTEDSHRQSAIRHSHHARRPHFASRRDMSRIPKFSLVPNQAISDHYRSKSVDRKTPPQIYHRLQPSWHKQALQDRMSRKDNRGSLMDVAERNDQVHQKKFFSENQETTRPMPINIVRPQASTIDRKSHEISESDETENEPTNVLSEPESTPENEENKTDQQHPKLLSSPVESLDNSISAEQVKESAVKLLDRQLRIKQDIESEQFDFRPDNPEGSLVLRPSSENLENFLPKSSGLSKDYDSRRNNPTLVHDMGLRPLVHTFNADENKEVDNLRMRKDEPGTLNIGVGQSKDLTPNNMFDKDSRNNGLESQNRPELPPAEVHFVDETHHAGPYRSLSPNSRERSFLTKPEFDHRMPWRQNSQNGLFHHGPGGKVNPMNEPRHLHPPNLPPPQMYRPIGEPPRLPWQSPTFDGPQLEEHPHSKEAKLLLEPMSNQLDRSTWLFSANDKPDISDHHKTRILDSVPFSAGINFDNSWAIGCPAQKCSKACPGGLRKLVPLTGCSSCDCCPTVVCKQVCPFGYDADDTGCPTCHCLQI